MVTTSTRPRTAPRIIPTIFEELRFLFSDEAGRGVVEEIEEVDGWDGSVDEVGCSESYLVDWVNAENRVGREGRTCIAHNQTG